MMWIKWFFMKLNHMEYWPFHGLYGSLYFYWFWLCLNVSSFFSVIFLTWEFAMIITFNNRRSFTRFIFFFPLVTLGVVRRGRPV